MLKNMFKKNNPFGTETNDFSEKARVKNLILGKTLALFGATLAFTFGFAFAILWIPAVQQGFTFILNRLVSSRAIGIGLLIVFIIVNIVGYWMVISRSLRIPMWVMIFFYGAIVFFDSISAALLILFVDADSGAKGLLIIIGVPFGVMGIMGFLAYKNIINFNKLTPLLIVLGISLIISSIIGFFLSNNNMLYTFVTALGTLFYTLYIGFILYQIKTEDDYLNRMPKVEWNEDQTSNYSETKIGKEMINRAVLAYSLLLFVAFIRLMYYVARIMGSFRK
ncbi:hypothetical protein NV226_02900 [Mycoplasma iguanae]|uniref:Inhibitor of apoptosis-promoting Bax1 n=1 Tax=Mycoplasma iguanae TaxID=292461 RepID=A0ABY5R836_9MOLU|nr:hypothetical protein [Mycoplasma iguanae]UVD81649.1 hypothetical protein NV226_02900 [Mycoplasma iguanae]